MKRIVIIFIVIVLSLSASAQKPQTVEDIDVWVQNEIKAARESFHKDSIDYMVRRTGNLNEKIKEIKDEAERLKKKIEKKIRLTKEPIASRQNNVEVKDSSVVSEQNKSASMSNIDLRPIDGTHKTSPTSPTSPRRVIAIEKSTSMVPSNSETVISLKKRCKDLLNNLVGEDEIHITRQFLHDFIAMSDDIGQYIQIKEDLSEIDRLLVQRGWDLTEFKSFIGDLHIVLFADSVLSSPYDKAKRIEAQSKMKGIKFLTDNQRKCSLVDSLSHGLNIYFLSTSNMLDLITEITECHKKYITSETDAERAAVSKELTFSIEFDARVKNFRSVKYMSNIYDKIISEILCYDENDGFVFQEFNMDGLKEIKASLEAMRQQK